MGPQPFSCGNGSPGHLCHSGLVSFNGATAFQLWKQERLLAGLQLLLEASMGPQPFSCGNSSLDYIVCVDLPSFNGATAFQLWKPRPFFDLCGYRKNSHFREGSQLTWSFSKVRLSSREFSLVRGVSSAPRTSRNHITSRKYLSLY